MFCGLFPISLSVDADSQVQRYREVGASPAYILYRPLMIGQASKQPPLVGPVIRLACHDFIQPTAASLTGSLTGTVWTPMGALQGPYIWPVGFNQAQVWAFESIIRCLAKPCQIFNVSTPCQLSPQHGKVPLIPACQSITGTHGPGQGNNQLQHYVWSLMATLAQWALFSQNHEGWRSYLFATLQPR